MRITADDMRISWGLYAIIRESFGKNSPQAKKARTQAMRYLREKSYDDNMDIFGGYIEIKWTPFRPYDEEWNAYDFRTEKCILPVRLTDDEINAFREHYWITFHDPYCDGRDCTGAPFTGYMRFYRCADRTVVIHRIDYDL